MKIIILAGLLYSMKIILSLEKLVLKRLDINIKL